MRYIRPLALTTVALTLIGAALTLTSTHHAEPAQSCDAPISAAPTRADVVRQVEGC